MATCGSSWLSSDLPDECQDIKNKTEAKTLKLHEYFNHHLHLLAKYDSHFIRRQWFLQFIKYQLSGQDGIAACS
jgi:hypothetical protein